MGLVYGLTALVVGFGAIVVIDVGREMIESIRKREYGDAIAALVTVLITMFLVALMFYVGVRTRIFWG